MSTVILSEIAAVRIDAACSMPARKLAGAAIAAASNSRLMVMPPPDVSATRETGPTCAPSASTASSERAGVGAIGGAAAKGLSLLCLAGGRKFQKFGSSQAGLETPSNGFCEAGANLDFIA